jgi:transcriptional regulator with XRE-family HTH domain
MLTLPVLLDRAKERAGFRSDGQLSRALGLTDSVVYQYRRGRTAPSDSVALQLAELAGMTGADVHAAVLLAASLRAKDDHLRNLYRAIAAKISAALVLISVSTQSPAAAEQALNKSASARPDVMIMR